MFQVSIEGFTPAPDLSRLEGVCEFINQQLILPVLGCRHIEFHTTSKEQPTGVIQLDCTDLALEQEVATLKAGLEFWLAEIQLPHKPIRMAGPFLEAMITSNPTLPPVSSQLEISEPAAEEILLGQLDGQRQPNGDIMLHVRRTLIKLQDLQQDTKPRVGITLSDGQISHAEHSEILTQLEAITQLALENDCPNLRATKL